MTYLFDTDTLSRFMRGEEPVYSRVLATAPDQIFLSSITVMEIEKGLERQPGKAKILRPVFEALLDDVRVLPFGVREARTTARVSNILRTLGLPIGPYDVQIAGTALEHGLILVSSNLREFQRVDGLNTQDWRFSS
jgi:tRNA(fMet)-specific endonuclease VapC